MSWIARDARQKRGGVGPSSKADPRLQHLALVRQSRAVDDTFARARHYGQLAIDSLAAFPESAAKDSMIEAVEFAVARAY